MQLTDFGWTHLRFNPPLHIGWRELVKRDEIVGVNVTASLLAIGRCDVAKTIVCMKSPVNAEYGIGYCFVGWEHIQ